MNTVQSEMYNVTRASLYCNKLHFALNILCCGNKSVCSLPLYKLRGRKTLVNESFHSVN
jgi:hypothetical protein